MKHPIDNEIICDPCVQSFKKTYRVTIFILNLSLLLIFLAQMLVDYDEKNTKEELQIKNIVLFVKL